MLSLQVNSGGLAGRLLVHVSTRRSSHSVSRAATTSGHSKTVSVRIGGLKKHTAYKVTATVSDTAGTAAAKGTAKTRK